MSNPDHAKESAASVVLLLDIMGTVVHDPFFEEVPAFFGLKLQELIELKHPTAWVEFESGLIDEQAFFAKFFRDGRRIDGLGLKEHMRLAYRWVAGMQPLLEELHRTGVPMHALTNYPPWYRLIEQRLGLSRYLQWSFVSCETGVRKPDHESYLGAARRLRRHAHECIFVDDRTINCEAARQVGMTAVRFVDAASFRSWLVDRGLLA